MACDTPYYVDNPKFGLTAKDYTKIPVPCGKCPSCIERRTNQWILRLNEEMKILKEAFFVTLTYSSEHVPITKNGFMSLQKTDLQKYFKRLRKITPQLIKYYAVGEYGTHRHRPHYHVILLGCSPQFITKAWTIGDVHVGQVTNASIAYCCKYLAKENVLTKRSRHARDDRQLERSFMSKRIGLNYLEKRTAWHQADLNRNYAVIDGGIKVPLPRYYREKLYTQEQRDLQNIEAEKLSFEKLEKEWNAYQLLYPHHTFEQFEKDIEQSLDHKLKTYNKNASRNRGD